MFLLASAPGVGPQPPPAEGLAALQLFDGKTELRHLGASTHPADQSAQHAPMKLLRNACALVIAMGALQPAVADRELKDVDGRRILLKDDGTWRYLDDQSAAKGASGQATPKDPPSAELRLLAQSELNIGCRFELQLSNNLPYEIRSLVPTFAISRGNGVVYSTESLHFGPIKPGDKTLRSVRFTGIACTEITALRVAGGDRCELGELNKFSDAKGECLARVRVLPSSALTFDK